MNSPPWMNKHILFSFTSLSSSAVDDFAQHGLTPPFVETIEPLIQDANYSKQVSPPPQVGTLPSMLTHIMTVDFHQDNREVSNTNY